jgi:hypothetical protein
MPRPPDIPNKPRHVIYTVRLTSEGLAALDERRGGWTRSEYVRRALALAIKANLRGPTGTATPSSTSANSPPEETA